MDLSNATDEELKLMLKAINDEMLKRGQNPIKHISDIITEKRKAGYNKWLQKKRAEKVE